MKFVLQRVSRARVLIDSEDFSSIGPGLLIFLCIEKDDTQEDVLKWAIRIPTLRLFSDNEGKMNLSLKDVGGQALVVSQFTLSANLREGLRPSFSQSERPDRAQILFDHFVNATRNQGIAVATGQFGAEMEIELTNDGPATFLL